MTELIVIGAIFLVVIGIIIYKKSKKNDKVAGKVSSTGAAEIPKRRPEDGKIKDVK